MQGKPHSAAAAGSSASNAARFASKALDNYPATIKNSTRAHVCKSMKYGMRYEYNYRDTKRQHLLTFVLASADCR